MNFIFLQEAIFNPQFLTGGEGMLGLFLAAIMAMLLVALIIGIALYVYTSFAYMAIARKANYPSPALAWIPVVGPAIVTSQIAKMHWWPILLLIGFVIPFVGWIFAIAFVVFSVIWNWKTFEAVKKPGWWAIFMIIPVLNIIFLVFLGIAAWSKD